MEAILDLYEKPYDTKRPMICFDEKSKQLLEDGRSGRSVVSGKSARQDYEYKRKGTVNIFMMAEPKAGHRHAKITHRRKKPDFAQCMKDLVDKFYSEAEKIDIVLDNLNTHFSKSLTETFDSEEAKRILDKIQFHYTPKHASWLNMAEIEIGIMDTQCLNRRIPTRRKLTKELKAWQKERNQQKKGIAWLFTKEKARKKFARFYSSI
jgi:hypothetical protein